MELIKLSKFKLQLQTLVTEVRELREKERVSSDQLHNHFQKQKERDKELSRKIMEMEEELASSVELGQKLERKVQFLEYENYLLESKHKELSETISSILQAKEGFVKAYQDSTCEMKRSFESRDRKIAMLSEKINGHLLLVDSIRKEASFVKRLVDSAQHVVDEKEEVVASLKKEMDKVCAFENLFTEKINDLETKLKNNENEFHRKDTMIAELQARLVTEKITDQCPLKLEELQETLLMKEGIIQTIISENKALHSELGMLEVTFKSVQDTMTHIDEEDRVALSLILANQSTEEDKEDVRINHDIQNCEANSYHKASGATIADITASTSCKEHSHIASPLRQNNIVNSYVSENGQSTLFPPCLLHSEPQPAAIAPKVPTTADKLDSECSTTKA